MPLLISDRLQFSLITQLDLQPIHELHSIPEIDKYNTLGIPESIDTTKKVITRLIEDNEKKTIQNYTFRLDNMSNEFIGLFGIKLSMNKYRRGEIWYKIHPKYWNKGYATEALKTVINFGFDELNLHRIEAGCAVGNIGSIKVLEKAGMTQEGKFRQLLPLKSGWSDNFEYSILESDPRKI